MAARKKKATRKGRDRLRAKNWRSRAKAKRTGVKKPMLQDPEDCNEEDALTQVVAGLHTHNSSLDDLRAELVNRTYLIEERIAEFTEKEMQGLRDYFEKQLDVTSSESQELVENVEVRRDEVKYQREESED